MDASVKLSKLYSVVCCILLRIGFGCSVELQPSNESVEVCSGTTVEVNCTTGTDRLYWRTSPECRVSYSKDDTALVGVVMPSCDFEAILLSTSPSLMSTATVSNVNSSHNGTVLTCVNTIVQLNLEADQMANISIFILDAPSAPLSPTFTPQSLSSVVLSWTPSDAECVVKYTIILTCITEGITSYIFYNTTTNTTSMTVSDLIQGADYLFTVAGMDGDDKVGESSELSERLTLDVPGAVVELNASVTPEVINITWMPPPPSTRPPVIEYKISHNITGNFTENMTNDTEYIVEYASPGVYQFTVLAHNVLGAGVQSTIFATVPTTHSGTMSGSMSGVSSTTDAGAPDSMIPSSPTVSTSAASTPSNSRSITPIFITVVGVILVILFVVILISGILAGKLYCSRSKPEKSKAGELIEDDQGTSSPPYLLATSSEQLKDAGTLQVCSEYSVVTTQFGGERKMSPAPVEDDHTYSKLNRVYKSPQNDGEYSEVRLTGQKEPPSLPSLVCVPPEPSQNPLPLPAKSSSRRVHYVELGQRDVNAPPILPPDVTVNYMQLRSNQERPNAPGHTSNGYSSKSPSKRPPPLPPRD